MQSKGSKVTNNKKMTEICQTDVGLQIEGQKLTMVDWRKVDEAINVNQEKENT